MNKVLKYLRIKIYKSRVDEIIKSLNDCFPDEEFTPVYDGGCFIGWRDEKYKISDLSHSSDIGFFKICIWFNKRRD